MFDPEVRATWFGEANVGNRSTTIAPVVSILTPGVGLSFGSRDCGLFRFGVRPEFPISPHCDDDDCYGNHNGDSRVGLKNWIVPEFLGEYRKQDWTAGLAYKQYDIQGCGALGSDLSLADLHTLTLYGKYKGFLLGASFVTNGNDDHSNTHSSVNGRVGLSVGYGYPF